MMWMAFLLFTITQIEYMALKHDIPDWYSYLVDEGFSQVWLNGICQSGICNFSQSSLHVGVFIDWLEKNDSRPHLEFCQMNIPVWYPWMMELSKLVAKDPALANLQPPPEQLQLATTFTYNATTITIFYHSLAASSLTTFSLATFISKEGHVLHRTSGHLPCPC